MNEIPDREARAEAIARCYLDAPEYSDEERFLERALLDVCETAEAARECVERIVHRGGRLPEEPNHA